MPPRKKPTKLPDLREYAEEAAPFDVVIRRIAKAKPEHKPDKPKRAKK